MFSDDFWQERGFAPMPAGAYFRLSALAVGGTVLAILLCSLFGSFIPLGLWIAGLAEVQRRRDKVWFGNTTFKRADHPYLFVYFVGGGYVIGLAVIAFAVYRHAVRAGAV